MRRVKSVMRLLALFGMASAATSSAIGGESPAPKTTSPAAAAPKAPGAAEAATKPTPATPPPPHVAGTWLTEDGSSKVRIEPCPETLCGRIVWLRDANDPDTGKPWRDKNNPDDKLRARPLVGLAILEQLVTTGTNAYKTSIYNPEDGKSYAGTVTLQSADRLKIKGCVFGGLFCGGETWSRAEK